VLKGGSSLPRLESALLKGGSRLESIAAHVLNGDSTVESGLVKGGSRVESGGSRLEQLSTATLVSVAAAAELARRRAKTETKIALKKIRTLRPEEDSSKILTEATSTLVEKLDDELSVESMVVEDAMESIIDTLDKAVAHTSTLIQHAGHAHSVTHTATTLTTHVAQHAQQLYTATSLVAHKPQLLETLSTVVHAVSMYSVGGIASAGVAVGLAWVVLPILNAANHSQDA